MKKSKMLLVTVLAFVLCLLCVTTSTFSWLQRPKDKSGNSLEWKPSYKTSVGSDISMKTYALNDDGSVPENPLEVTVFSNQSGLSSGSRKYYRTDITNSGTASQSVSLFLSSINSETIDGSFRIGVNSPLKTYKSYPQELGLDSPQLINKKVASDKMRIYFQQNGVWTDKTCTIYCDGAYFADLTYILNDRNGGKTYYVDIPIDTKKFYFTYAYPDTSNGSYRTQDINTNISEIAANSSKVFKLTNTTDPTYKNQNYDIYSVQGANFINKYNSISLKNNATFSLNLIQNTDYIGKSISYSSSNTSVFTVNESGTITAVAEGTATLTTTITGETYSDTISVDTKIVVSESSSDVPIVTNLEIPAASDANNPTYVYWYIKNEGSSDLIYTIAGIYLSL